MQAHPNAQIFVATDQQQYLDQFKSRFGKQVITSDAMRTSGQEPLFRINEGSKFKRGLEVMMDCLILSRCNCLIKGWSNVSETAICFNPSIAVIDVMHEPNVDELDFKNLEPAVSQELIRLHESLLAFDKENNV